jgi:hypothetical protein
MNLTMARLAESLQKSFSAFQGAGVIMFLDSGDTRGLAELTISQKNALLVLVQINDRDTLREYFKGGL